MNKEKSHSYQDIADLTHTEQILQFNFCLCEEVILMVDEELLNQVK